MLAQIIYCYLINTIFFLELNKHNTFYVLTQYHSYKTLVLVLGYLIICENSEKYHNLSCNLLINLIKKHNIVFLLYK